MIIYSGKSQLDNQTNIVCIATDNSNNQKTGAMVQTWILHADLDPISANRWGNDRGICGDCIHRGQEKSLFTFRGTAAGRSCYVLLLGPQSIYRTYVAGGYKTARPDKLSKLGRGRIIRVGSYGDPAAVPAHVWEELLSEADTFTAYSHQSGWRPDIAMQSADDYHSAVLHWKAGRRTFRVISELGHLDRNNEALCPASKEAGRRVQCTACKLCKGSNLGKSIAIVEH